MATEDLARPEGRNQTKKLKCKTQNFGIPASRDNSLLSKQLRQPCRKNTHKKQEDERLYYRGLRENNKYLCKLVPSTPFRAGSEQSRMDLCISVSDISFLFRYFLSLELYKQC